MAKIHRISRIPTLALACFYASATVLGAAQPDLTDDAGERFRDVELFGVIAIRSLDDDCDGFLTVEQLATASGLSMDDPETVERMEEYDGNDDGKVTPTELSEGILAGVRAQVDITMLVDANDDGELTLKEHALGFPDREGKPDVDGFTPRQIQGFRFLDGDGNERVTREEVTDRHETTFLVILWAQTVDHHMKRIDVDGDGLVRAGEFAKGFGYESFAELPSEQKTWYDTVATDHGGAPAIALRVFRIQLLQGRPVTSRMAMERPIRPLLVPACAAGAQRDSKGDHL